MILRSLLIAAVVNGCSASDAPSQGGTASFAAARIPSDGMTDFGGASPIRPESWFDDFDWPETQYLPATVDVEFVITAIGRAERCVVKRTSYPSIGKRVCAIVVDEAKFNPPRALNGKPRATHARMRWKFDIR
jgi:hypothetical protein